MVPMTVASDPTIALAHAGDADGQHRDDGDDRLDRGGDNRRRVVSLLAPVGSVLVQREHVVDDHLLLVPTQSRAERRRSVRSRHARFVSAVLLNLRREGPDRLGRSRPVQRAEHDVGRTRIQITAKPTRDRLR
jgi:hypothetical protein